MVITPKFFTIFVCSHVTANRISRHFSTRRRAAKTAKHSLGVYYHPPESSPCCNSLSHNKFPYIFSKTSYYQSKQPTPPSPDRGSSFAPAESNIHDTLSTGIRPGYNMLSRMKSVTASVIDQCYICVDLKGQVVRAKTGYILLMFLSTGQFLQFSVRAMKEVHTPNTRL